MFKKLIVMYLLSCTAYYVKADPVSAIQAVDNVLRATSLVDLIAKAQSKGINVETIKQIPTVKIEADCSECKISHATRRLLKASYEQYASQNNIAIEANQIQTFKVTHYKARNAFARGTLGMLSGADYIEGYFNDDETHIHEYSISHEMGIDEITQSLGQDMVKYQINKNIDKAN